MRKVKEVALLDEAEKKGNVTSIFDRIAEKKNQMGDKELDIRVIPDKKKQQVL